MTWYKSFLSNSNSSTRFAFFVCMLFNFQGANLAAQPRPHGLIGQLCYNTIPHLPLSTPFPDLFLKKWKFNRNFPEKRISGRLSGKNESVCPGGLFKQQGNGPDSSQRDERVNNAADDRSLSAEKPGDEVKLEYADASPAQRADNDKDERNFVQHQSITPFFP